MCDIAGCSYIMFHLLFMFRKRVFLKKIHVVISTKHSLVSKDMCLKCSLLFQNVPGLWQPHRWAGRKSGRLLFAAFLHFISNSSKTICFCKMLQFGRWVFCDKSSASSEKSCWVLLIICWERDETDVFRSTNHRAWLIDFPSCLYPLSLNCYYQYHDGSYRTCRLHCNFLHWQLLNMYFQN